MTNVKLCKCTALLRRLWGRVFLRALAQNAYPPSISQTNESLIFYTSEAIWRCHSLTQLCICSGYTYSWEVLSTCKELLSVNNIDTLSDLFYYKPKWGQGKIRWLDDITRTKWLIIAMDRLNSNIVILGNWVLQQQLSYAYTYCPSPLHLSLSPRHLWSRSGGESDDGGGETHHAPSSGIKDW